MSSDCFLMACTYCSSLFFSSWRRRADAEITENHLTRDPPGLTERVRPRCCLFQRRRGDESRESESQELVQREGGRRDRSLLPEAPGKGVGRDMPAGTPILPWGPGDLLWGRLSCPHKNTPPLCSFAFFFFYCASQDLPVCLTATSDLCVCPCTLNTARAPDLIVCTGTLALQLLAQF